MTITWNGDLQREDHTFIESVVSALGARRDRAYGSQGAFSVVLTGVHPDLIEGNSKPKLDAVVAKLLARPRTGAQGDVARTNIRLAYTFEADKNLDKQLSEFDVWLSRELRSPRITDPVPSPARYSSQRRQSFVVPAGLVATCALGIAALTLSRGPTAILNGEDSTEAIASITFSVVLIASALWIMLRRR